MFNNGQERNAVEHYDRALSYDASDEIRDTALYAKAVTLEAIYNKQQSWEEAATGYWEYLATHAYGRVPDYATYGLGRIYSRAGDLDGAQYFMEYLRDQYPESDLHDAAQRGLNEIQADARLMYAESIPAVSGRDGRQMCGPVALQKLLAMEGVEADLEELATVACTDTEGTTMQGLVEAARAKGKNLGGRAVGAGQGP